MTTAGTLIAVVGPSGAGKDTLIDAACAARPDLVRARRVITRPASAGGEDFEGVTEAEFAARLAWGDFALHWRAHGLAYGIPVSILADLSAGRTVLFNGSRAMLQDAAIRFPRLRVVAVTAPADLLAARLATRGRETSDDIAARLSRAGWTLPDGALLVVNDATPQVGVARFLSALSRATESA